MKKLLAIISLVAIMALSLVACGGGDTTTSTPAEPTTSVSETSSVASEASSVSEETSSVSEDTSASDVSEVGSTGSEAA